MFPDSGELWNLEVLWKQGDLMTGAFCFKNVHGTK